MTWLNGKPLRTRRLQPPNDPDSSLGGTSILDDLVLQFFRKRLANGTWQTNVYLADLRQGGDNLAFARVAEIPLDLAKIELMPSRNGGFGSVEWSQG